jgi:hypothetical protein
VGWGVHRADPDVVEGEGDEWPPDHGLVDVDAPGGEDIGDHEGVAETFQHHVVVVLAA